MKRPRRRASFSDIKAEIGEDPAAFLDQDLLANADEIKGRIDAIDYVDVVERWIEVEVALDRGPRQRIVGMLNKRKSWLDEHGERSERIEQQGQREVRDVETTAFPYGDGRRYRNRRTKHDTIKREYADEEGVTAGETGGAAAVAGGSA